MNSLESQSHGHKYFEYEWCTPTPKPSNQYVTPHKYSKPSNQNVTPHKYSEHHPIRTSHPINTANNWTSLECENGTRTRKFYEQYVTWSNIQNPYFCMQTLLGSSLPPLLTLFVFDCLVMFNTYCVVFFFFFFALFVFVLCIPMLSVSQDCQFLIAPSVFSNVHLTLKYQVWPQKNTL